jgi:hypothetical protein
MFIVVLIFNSLLRFKLFSTEASMKQNKTKQNKTKNTIDFHVTRLFVLLGVMNTPISYLCNLNQRTISEQTKEEGIE